MSQLLEFLDQRKESTEDNWHMSIVYLKLPIFDYITLCQQSLYLSTIISVFIYLFFTFFNLKFLFFVVMYVLNCYYAFIDYCLLNCYSDY